MIIDTTMTEEFYIVKPNDSLWQLRMTRNKECLATANTLDDLLLRLNNILKRYVTPENLHDAWNNSDIRKMSPTEKERNVKLYNEQKDMYKQHIEDAIQKLNENYKQPMTFNKRKKTIVKRNVNLEPKEEPQKPVEVSPRKTIIKRKVKVNR